MLNRLLSVFLIVCPIYLFAQKNIATAFSFKNDTLKSKISLCDSQGRTAYYRLLNLTVDSNFLLINTAECNLNADKFPDYIFIFSNKMQDGDLKKTDCKIRYNRRLLLILLSKGNKFDIPIINENVILNTSEYQSDPFRKLVPFKKGFKLEFYFGTRIRYYYDFFFMFDGKKDFFLYKSKSESYDIHVSGTNEFKEKNYSKAPLTNLRSINIRNFIKT